MVSRNEGYRNSAGKERPSLDIVSSFLRSEFDVQLTAIEDAEENYRSGDFRTPWGSTIECKVEEDEAV